MRLFTCNDIRSVAKGEKKFISIGRKIAVSIPVHYHISPTDMDHIIRTGGKVDRKKFVEMVLMSAPYFPALFGPEISRVVGKMFDKRKNLFSHRHVWVLEKNHEPAGMLLGYDDRTKRKENIHTGFFLFRYLHFRLILRFPVLLRFNNTVGVVPPRSFYISNVGTFPSFRKQGLAKMLMRKAEEEARRQGAQSMVLDVEKENLSAIALYRSLGYQESESFSIHFNDQLLNFVRMIKNL